MCISVAMIKKVFWMDGWMDEYYFVEEVEEVARLDQ